MWCRARGPRSTIHKVCRDLGELPRASTHGTHPLRGSTPCPEQELCRPAGRHATTKDGVLSRHTPTLQVVTAPDGNYQAQANLLGLASVSDLDEQKVHSPPWHSLKSHPPRGAACASPLRGRVFGVDAHGARNRVCTAPHRDPLHGPCFLNVRSSVTQDAIVSRWRACSKVGNEKGSKATARCEKTVLSRARDLCAVPHTSNTHSSRLLSIRQGV